MLSKKNIDKVFLEAEDQYDVLIGLYKLVYPELEMIKGVEGHPKINKELNIYIFDKAITFDKIHHPDVMAGGMWMNRGFSGREEVKRVIRAPVSF